MPNDPIQGQGQGQSHGGSKVAIVDDFKVCASVHVRLMVNYDKPRQYLNYNWTHFFDLQT